MTDWVPLASPDCSERSPSVGKTLQWLVSVRSWDEFLTVAAVPPEIIDFKEPRLGPMAATEPELWSRVAAATLNPAVALSVALGGWQSAVSIAGSVPAGIRFAKMGGEGLETVDALARQLDQVRDNLLSEIELVPVAYADHLAAGSIRVESVLQLCERRGNRRLLVDTFTKQGDSSLKCLGIDRWREIVKAARDAGVWLSLAGGISLDDAREIVADPAGRPDCIGIRGAICSRGRDSAVCSQRLALWQTWHGSLVTRRDDLESVSDKAWNNRYNRIG
jgi:(5-formylfuran-3-yl)methyl phosphate synthase